MASVRKKEGKPRKDGTRPMRWVVDWYDAQGARNERSFTSRKDANALAAAKTLDPGRNADKTVRQVSDGFLTYYQNLWHEGERSRSTYEQKRQHLEHLFKDPLSRERMDDVDAPALQAFFDRLIQNDVSYKTARKIASTVKQMIKWGALRGTPAKQGVEAAHVIASRSKRLAAPAEIPPRDKCREILQAADERAQTDRGRARAALRILMLCGLRVGELRALDWSDVTLTGATPRVSVRRSADKWNTLAAMPKTDSSYRSVAISPETVQALKAWKVACPPTYPDVSARLVKGGANGALVFPNGEGKVWDNASMNRNMWTPILRQVGLASSRPSKRIKRHPNGDYREKVWTPDYPLKASRHVAASVAIANGAREKWVMDMMGHATMKLTMDLYGHLWPDHEQDALMAKAADRAFD